MFEMYLKIEYLNKYKALYYRKIQTYKNNLAVLCLVAQSYLTLCDPMTVAHQALLSILQARTLE